MVSASGFTMNVDWYQEATLGPQSLLKTLAGCQENSNARPWESQAGSLSAAGELHGTLGVIIFSTMLRLIVP